MSLPTNLPTATSLTGTVAWVLGGGSGIGEGAALALAASGATVIVSGRREAELAKVAAKAAAAGSTGQVFGVPVDVSDAADVAQAAQRIADEHGTVGILVYSAGTNVTNRYWRDTTPEDYARVLDINLTGAMRAVHAVLPGMRAQQDGLVLIVSSWAGFRFAPGVGAGYSTSKTALGQLVETINHQERLNGIRATHLCPGEVKTDILKLRPQVPTEEQQALMLTPQDMGDAVSYLAHLPARICVNEFVITPTTNTSYDF